VNKTVGSYLAMSVAALFSAGCERESAHGNAETQAEPKEGKGAATESAAASMEKARSATGSTVPCLGIHECKGKSACHVAGGHACAGQNECKGKGWIQVPRAECEAKGGKILDS
jgi:hypothetical protein